MLRAISLSFLFGISAFGLTLEVPAVRQATEYTCGAAAMVAALGYYGFDYNESELARRMGTDSVDGTAMSEIEKMARSVGLTAKARSGVTMADLERHLNKKQLAIVAVQAWAADPATDYRNTWSEGHYMIVVGLDADTIYFMDPAMLGGRASLARKEFLEARWHDVSDGKQLQQPAILLEGTPKPAPLWPNVD